MADIAAPAELKVTTGPIRGSPKVHVPAPGNPSVRVAMREIALDPSSGEPPLPVYDTPGPYTDPAARIDIMARLPALRRSDEHTSEIQSLMRNSYAVSCLK